MLLTDLSIFFDKLFPKISNINKLLLVCLTTFIIYFISVKLLPNNFFSDYWKFIFGIDILGLILYTIWSDNSLFRNALSDILPYKFKFIEITKEENIPKKIVKKHNKINDMSDIRVYGLKEYPTTMNQQDNISIPIYF